MKSKLRLYTKKHGGNYEKNISNFDIVDSFNGYASDCLR